MSFQGICTAAGENPSKIAIVHNGIGISYAEFSCSIDATIRYLETQKLPAGSMVVVVIHNLLDCWVAVLALQHLGLNTVCVSSTQVTKAMGLDNFVATVTTELEVSRHQPKVEADKRVITIPNPAFDSDEILPGPAIDESAEIGGHILYTSGTTGRYKTLLWVGNLQKRRDAQRIAIDDYDIDTVYHCANFNLWTAAGYTIPRSVWQARGCVIVDQRPQWCEYFLGSGMTKAFLVPNLANQLLNTLEQQVSSSPLDFSLTVAGGFISRSVAERLIQRVTTNLRILYGSTEINLFVMEANVTNLDDMHWLGCRDDRTVEIIDEVGCICPIDVAGQLRICLADLDCSSYLDNPEASEKVFRDGFFYPGDMAIRRADGRIRILGRSADVVNFRGQKTASAPIEQSIQTHLGIENVCLFSGINSEGEEEVVIAMESERWPEATRLDHLGHEFTQFDQVRFAIVHPFPRTQTGTSKVDRVALRKLIFPKR